MFAADLEVNSDDDLNFGLSAPCIVGKNIVFLYSRLKYVFVVAFNFTNLLTVQFILLFAINFVIQNCDSNIFYLKKQIVSVNKIGFCLW